MELLDQLYTAKDVSALDETGREVLRRRCKTDLFFLANHVLRSQKDPPLIPRVHKGICDTMVQKNPDLPLEQWSEVKQRVVLSSRGTLKTVIECADITQIILCDPNVRILILSGKLDLAQSILGVVRNHFLGNDVIQALFPEYCSTYTRIVAEEYTTSARSGVNYREPTLSISTFDSVKAGLHVNWIKMDDCTNEINSSSPEQREKTIEKYDDLDPILEPGGYKDLTATPWARNDLPDIIKDRGDEYERDTGIKLVKYFFQPIWTLKDDPDGRKQGERLQREKHGTLKPDDVDLLWPEKLNAQFLWPIYRANRKKFDAQYLLRPHAETEELFTRDLLVKQTKPIDCQPLPHKSWMFMNWDLAGVSGKGDYSVGIAAFWEDTRRMFIVDARVARFTSSTEAAREIVLMFKKWMPVTRCRIESAGGAKFLEGEILEIARSLGVPIVIDWVVPENTADAKKTRVMSLSGAMRADKIQFWEGLPYLSEIYTQFEKFTGRGKYKDDGPDCIAQLWQQYNTQIYPALVPTMLPSGKIVHEEPFEPEIAEPVDTHQDETQYADVAWLESFTSPHA